KVQLDIGAATKPGTSAGMTPGHLASENLDPALTSFPNGNTADPNDAGKLCADLVADSLDQTPIPAPLLPPGMTACGEGYTAQSSFLDLLVGGCKIMGFIQVLSPTQPDKVDAMAPPAGAGGPYTFTTDAAHNVTGCNDKGGAKADLAMCLKAAAYSSY